jgi:hypothetical protein
VSYLFGKSVLRGKKVLNHFASMLFFFSTYYIMYEYMCWHVLLTCTVGMCCTDCIVPFLHYRGGNLYEKLQIKNVLPELHYQFVIPRKQVPS